jgi:hypothetical protein
MGNVTAKQFKRRPVVQIRSGSLSILFKGIERTGSSGVEHRDKRKRLVKRRTMGSSFDIYEL